MKNTERFSNRVENYVKYRPHYPQAIITCLQSETGLTPNAVIADVGAGTGISCMPFLENGNTVFAVEPNKPMRQAAIALLHGYPTFSAIDGTAERTTLPDASVDYIVAGQAFHWFNQSLSRDEFRRIGKPGAWTVLMWNERLTGTGFEKDYEQLLLDFGTDYTAIDHRNVGPAQLAAFYDPYAYHAFSFQNAQQFDRSGLTGRLLSSSYVPQADHPNYMPMLNRLEDIFERWQEQGMVKFHYLTRLYIGQL
ncbi:class I SAM-dependent methyltransferase [Chitinophaga lutea]